MSVAPAVAGPPTVRDVILVDVAPRSFSVVWTTNEPAVAGLRVFAGPACTDQLGDIVVTPHPTRRGDPAIRQAAELSGVMKAQASKLVADTPYCFQTVTTSKSSGEVTIFPPAPAPVRTAAAVVRGLRAQPGDPLRPFSNDLIDFSTFLPDQATPATGALLVVALPGSATPVSGFVGDGVAAPAAMVDLNNLFGSVSGVSLDLLGGERMVIRALRGLGGDTLVHFRETPPDQGLAELKPPQVCFFADLDCSGAVDIVDLQRELNRLGTRTGDSAFNPDFDVVTSGGVDDADVQALQSKFGQARPFP